MKNNIITILVVIVIVVGFTAIFLSGPREEKIPTTATPVVNQQADSSQKWETKTEEQASVTVVVTPIDLSPDSKEWKFDVGMNTHSVELDQDMTKIAVLVDDKGKEYKPISWDGPIGGHHREGVLIFNEVTPTPKSVELKISGIGDVVRSFTWQLE